MKKIVFLFLVSVLFFTSCDVKTYRLRKECEEIQKLLLRDKNSYEFVSFEYYGGILDSDRHYDYRVTEFCDERLERGYMDVLTEIAYTGFKNSIHEKIDTTNNGVTLYETYRLQFYAKNGFGLSTIGESYWIYSWRCEDDDSGERHVVTPKKLVAILHCDEELKYIYNSRNSWERVVDFSNWEVFETDEFFINAKVSCEWYGKRLL